MQYRPRELVNRATTARSHRADFVQTPAAELYDSARGNTYVVVESAQTPRF